MTTMTFLFLSLIWSCKITGTRSWEQNCLSVITSYNLNILPLQAIGFGDLLSQKILATFTDPISPIFSEMWQSRFSVIDQWVVVSMSVFPLLLLKNVGLHKVDHLEAVFTVFKVSIPRSPLGFLIRCYNSQRVIFVGVNQ